jgi:hypothetical protein
MGTPAMDDLSVGSFFNAKYCKAVIRGTMFCGLRLSFKKKEKRP